LIQEHTSEVTVTFLESKRTLWSSRIEAWKASGKSGAAWCREQQISYNTFGYWKQALGQIEKRPTFVELSEDSQGMGITLECNEITIRLEENYCIASLKSLLELLKQC